MYEDYSFVLYWDELSDDLRDEKIENYIKFNYNENYGSDWDSLSESEKDDIIDKEYSAAEQSIKARFPIYF